jgi:hypothetical protein
MDSLLDISSPATASSDQSLINQYTQTPFADVPGRILLVFLNRSAAQAHSDRRYVVQVAVAVANGAKTKQVRREHCRQFDMGPADRQSPLVTGLPFARSVDVQGPRPKVQRRHLVPLA